MTKTLRLKIILFVTLEELKMRMLQFEKWVY